MTDTNYNRPGVFTEITEKNNYKEGGRDAIVLNGFYIPDPEKNDPSHTKSKQYEFRVTKRTDPFNNYEWEFVVANDDFDYPTFRMYHEAFLFFMKEVLDKNKSSERPYDYDKMIPVYNGTWESVGKRMEQSKQLGNDIALSEALQNGTYPTGANPYLSKREGGRAGRKGYGSTRKHNRRPTRRKPTKRRGSRRGNRKTKKN